MVILALLEEPVEAPFFFTGERISSKQMPSAPCKQA